MSLADVIVVNKYNKPVFYFSATQRVTKRNGRLLENGGISEKIQYGTLKVVGEIWKKEISMISIRAKL